MQIVSIHMEAGASNALIQQWFKNRQMLSHYMALSQTKIFFIIVADPHME